MSAGQAGYVLLRGWLLKRILHGLRFSRHIIRAVSPALPAVALILALRGVEPTRRTVGLALAELAIFAAVTVCATWLFERDLLRQVYGYVRGRSGMMQVAGAPPADVPVPASSRAR
jgi:hypothetical protein